jgi:hypothetical protein
VIERAPRREWFKLVTGVGHDPFSPKNDVRGRCEDSALQKGLRFVAGVIVTQ